MLVFIVTTLVFLVASCQDGRNTYNAFRRGRRRRPSEWRDNLLLRFLTHVSLYDAITAFITHLNFMHLPMKW
jgi:membrane associated rhomboid family serine protease